MKRSSSPILRLLGGLVSILLAMLMLVWLTSTDPIATAQALPEAAGTSLIGVTTSDGLFGGKATVRLQPTDKASGPIEIKLSRPPWSRRWRKSRRPLEESSHVREDSAKLIP